MEGGCNDGGTFRGDQTGLEGARINQLHAARSHSSRSLLATADAPPLIHGCSGAGWIERATAGLAHSGPLARPKRLRKGESLTRALPVALGLPACTPVHSYRAAPSRPIVSPLPERLESLRAA